MFRSKSLLRCTQAVINNQLGNNTSSTSLCKLTYNNNEQLERNENHKSRLKENKSLSKTKSETIASECLGKEKWTSTNILETINKTLSKHTLKSSSCSRLFELTKKTFAHNNNHKLKSISQSGIDILHQKQKVIFQPDNFNTSRNSTNNAFKNVKIISNSLVSSNKDNINITKLNNVEKELEPNYKNHDINNDSKERIEIFNSSHLNIFDLKKPNEQASTLSSKDFETNQQYQSKHVFKKSADELDKLNIITNYDNSNYLSKNYFREITNETEIKYKDKNKKLNITIKEKRSFLKNNHIMKVKNNQLKYTNCNHFKITDLKCMQKVKYLNQRNIKTNLKNNFSSKNCQSNMHKVHHQLKNISNYVKRNRISKYDTIANFEEIINANFTETNLKNYKISEIYENNNNKQREKTDQNTFTQWQVCQITPTILNNDLISRKLNNTQRILSQNFKTTTDNNLIKTLQVEEPEPIKQHKKKEPLKDDSNIYVVTSSQIQSESNTNLQKETTENKMPKSLHNGNMNIQEVNKLNSILQSHKNMYFNEQKEDVKASEGKRKGQPLDNKPVQSTGSQINKATLEELEGAKLCTSNENNPLNSIYTLMNAKTITEMVMLTNLEKETPKQDKVIRSIYNGQSNLYKNKSKTENKNIQSGKIDETGENRYGKKQESVLETAHNEKENSEANAYSLLIDKENLTNLKEKKSSHSAWKINETFPGITNKKKSEAVPWKADNYYEQMNSRISFKDNRVLNQEEYILKDAQKKIRSSAWIKGDQQVTDNLSKDATGKKHSLNGTKETIQEKETIRAIPWIKGQQNYAINHNAQIVNGIDRKGILKNNWNPTIPSLFPESQVDMKTENSEKLNVLMKNINSTSAIPWMRNKGYTSDNNIFCHYHDKIALAHINKNYSQTAFESKKREPQDDSETVFVEFGKYEEMCNTDCCNDKNNNEMIGLNKCITKCDKVKSNNVAEKTNINKDVVKKNNINKKLQPAKPWIRGQNILNINMDNVKTSFKLEAAVPWVREDNNVTTNINDRGRSKNPNNVTPWIRGENIVVTHANKNGTYKNLKAVTPWIRGENTLSDHANANRTSKDLKIGVQCVKHLNISEVTANECRISKNLNTATAWERGQNVLNFHKDKSNMPKNFKECDIRLDHTLITAPATHSDDSKIIDIKDSPNENKKNENFFNTIETTNRKEDLNPELSVLWKKGGNTKGEESLYDKKITEAASGLEKRNEVDTLLANTNKQLTEMILNNSTNKMKEMKLFSAARTDSKSTKGDSKHIRNELEETESKQQFFQHNNCEKTLPLYERSQKTIGTISSKITDHFEENNTFLKNKNLTKTSLKSNMNGQKSNTNKNFKTKSSSDLDVTNINKLNGSKRFDSETFIAVANDEGKANCKSENVTKTSEKLLINKLISFRQKEGMARFNFLVDKLITEHEKYQFPVKNKVRDNKLFETQTQNIPISFLREEMETTANQNSQIEIGQLKEETTAEIENKPKLKVGEKEIKQKHNSIYVDGNKMEQNNDHNLKKNFQQITLPNAQEVKQNSVMKNKPQQHHKEIKSIYKNQNDKKSNNTEVVNVLKNCNENAIASKTVVLKQLHPPQEETKTTVNNNNHITKDNKNLKNIHTQLNRQSAQNKTLQCDLDESYIKKPKNNLKIDTDKVQSKEIINEKPLVKLTKEHIKTEQEKTASYKLQEGIHKQITDGSNFLSNIETNDKNFKINTKSHEHKNTKEDKHKNKERKELMKISNGREDNHCIDNQFHIKSGEAVIDDRSHAERIAEFYDLEDSLLGFTRQNHENPTSNNIPSTLQVIMDSNCFQTSTIFDPIMTPQFPKCEDVNTSTEVQQINYNNNDRIKKRAYVINNFTDIDTAEELMKLQNDNQISNKIDSKDSETLKAFQNTIKVAQRNHLSKPKQNTKSTAQLRITIQRDSRSNETLDIGVKENQAKNNKMSFKENEIKYKTEVPNKNISRTYNFSQLPEEMIKIAGKCEENNDSNNCKTIVAHDRKCKQEIPINDDKLNMTTQNQNDTTISKLASQINKSKEKNYNSSSKTTLRNEAAEAKVNVTGNKQSQIDKSDNQEVVQPPKTGNKHKNSGNEIPELKEETNLSDWNKNIENLTEKLNSSLNINMLKEIFDYQLHELTGDVTMKNKENEEKDSSKTESEFNYNSTEILHNEQVTICVPHRTLSAKSILVNNNEKIGKPSQEKVTPIIKTMLNAVIYTVFKNENTYKRLTKSQKKSNSKSQEASDNQAQGKKHNNVAVHALKNEKKSDWIKRPFIMPINDTRFPMINNKKLKLQYPKPLEANVITTNDQMVYKHVPSVSKVLNETLPESTMVDLQNWEQNQQNMLGEAHFEEFYREQLKNDTQFHDCIRRHILGTPMNVLKENVSSRLSGSLHSLKKMLSQLSNITVLESPVVHPELPYHGIVDCIGCYNNEPVLIEWKQADHRKSVERTYDAPLQLSAYIGALNYDQNYKLPIKNGIIVIAYTDGSPADVLPLSYEECLKNWKLWLERLNRYLTLKA